jgi:hypothetical protein
MLRNNNGGEKDMTTIIVGAAVGALSLSAGVMPLIMPKFVGA